MAGKRMYKIIFGTYLDNGSQKYLGGLIARAKNGILVIENVRRLSPQCYFLLIQYMQSGGYTISSGKQGRYLESKCIIFTSCRDSKQNIHNAFLSQHTDYLSYPKPSKTDR